jgi:hypothetical protein
MKEVSFYYWWQRAGIADGREIESRPPGTDACLFDKVEY